MAFSIRNVTRFRSPFFFTLTVKQHVCDTPGRSFSSFSSGREQSRSSLFEHIQQGYSDKPELDMRRVCEHTDQVITEVENRKGDLGAVDVRAIISSWKQLQEIQKEINELEEHKKSISVKVRTLVEQHDKSVLSGLIAYKTLREEGRKIRVRLNHLYSQQSDLEKEYYYRALRLPNRTHPDVVAVQSLSSLNGLKSVENVQKHLITL